MRVCSLFLLSRSAVSAERGPEEPTSPCAQQVGEGAEAIPDSGQVLASITLHGQLTTCVSAPLPPCVHPLTSLSLSPFLSRFNICEVAASPARTGGHLVSDLVPGVAGDSARSVRARLCGSRIRPAPPQDLAMEMMEGDVMDKLEDVSSVYDFDPITGNIPATKVEITVSCR